MSALPLGKARIVGKLMGRNEVQTNEIRWCEDVVEEAFYQAGMWYWGAYVTEEELKQLKSPHSVQERMQIFWEFAQAFVEGVASVR